MFHRFITIYKCRLIHKPRLYTSYNIPSFTSHQLWTWYFLQLIKYNRSPYFVSISSTLNHKLQSKSILHPFFQISSRLHLPPWRSSAVIVPSLKTPNPYFFVVWSLVVERTYAQEAFLLFLELVYPTSNSNMGFL
jgi:hypothetical protein